MECNQENLNWTSDHFSSLSDNADQIVHPASGIRSYPPQSTLRSSPSMISHDGSICNTLQISVIALKDRCLKQQRKIENLEEENSRLYYALGLSELPFKGTDGISGTKEGVKDPNVDHIVAFKRLQEANYLLRQRNLELNEKLVSKSDTSRIPQTLTTASMEQTGKNIKNICDPKTNSSIRFENTGCVNGCVEEIEVEEAEEDDEEENVNPNSHNEISKDCGGKSLSKIQLTDRNLKRLKEQLLSQQKLMIQQVQTISSTFATNRNMTESDYSPSTLELPSVALVKIRPSMREKNEIDCQENIPKDVQDVERLCPMCEANFPNDEIMQEDFEAHVLAHFSYEDEAVTQTNYDMVLDAQRSLDGDF